MNTKKISIITIVTLLIAVAAYFVFMNKPNSTQPVNTETNLLDRRGGGQGRNLPENWGSMTDEEQQIYREENIPEPGSRTDRPEGQREEDRPILTE